MENVVCYYDNAFKMIKFYFVIISLKNYNLAKSRNFTSPISKIMGGWGSL